MVSKEPRDKSGLSLYHEEGGYRVPHHSHECKSWFLDVDDMLMQIFDVRTAVEEGLIGGAIHLDERLVVLISCTKDDVVDSTEALPISKAHHAQDCIKGMYTRHSFNF